MCGPEDLLPDDLSDWTASGGRDCHSRAFAETEGGIGKTSDGVFWIPDEFLNGTVIESQPTKSVHRRVRLANERNIVAISPSSTLQPRPLRKSQYLEEGERCDWTDAETQEATVRACRSASLEYSSFASTRTGARLDYSIAAMSRARVWTNSFTVAAHTQQEAIVKKGPSQSEQLCEKLVAPLKTFVASAHREPDLAEEHDRADEAAEAEVGGNPISRAATTAAESTRQP